MALTPEQVEFHNSHLTASRIAGILGLSPWQSRYSVFQELSGHIEHEEKESERMLLGWYAEEMLTAYLRKEKGWTINRTKKGMEHPQHKFIGGLVDGLLTEKGKPTHVIEYKNIDGLYYKNWRDEGIPSYYEVQCRIYSAITSLPVKLVVLFGGNKVEIYDIPRNLQIEDFLIHECFLFWQDLMADKCPDVDGSSATTEAIKSLYPAHTEDIFNCGDNKLRADLTTLFQLKEQLKIIETEKSFIENKFKAAIADREGLMFEDGSKVTWKKTRKGHRLFKPTIKEISNV